MSVVSLGFKNIGKKKDGNARASMNWQVNVSDAGGAAGDGNPSQLIIPGLLQGNVAAPNSFLGWKFVLDPTVYQGAFTFAAIKTLQIDVMHLRGWITPADPAACYQPGRVVVSIPATGQLFLFAPESPIPSGGGTTSDFYESKNVIVPVEIPNTAQILVYVESDANGGVPSDTAVYHTVDVTAFNYDLPSLGF